jgi:tetratricopeptide (TPR) repeat protein
MSDQPSFQQIADLFQLELPRAKDLAIASTPRKRRGDDANESEDLGRQSLNEGDFEAAIRHFKTACEQRDNKDADTLVDLGSAYEYGNQEPEALRQYQKALRLQKDAAEPQLGLAELYKRHGRFRDAIEHLEKAIQNEPGNSFYHIKMAETLREMGEPNKALIAARNAVLVKPDESFYYYWIGDLLTELKRYDEALDSLRAAIELSPGDDFLFQRTVVPFWCLGRQTEAIKAARLASDLDPEKNLYHGLLELLLANADMKEDAALETKAASKMDRYDQEMLRRMAVEMGLIDDQP